MHLVCREDGSLCIHVSLVHKIDKTLIKMVALEVVTELIVINYKIGYQIKAFSVKL